MAAPFDEVNPVRKTYFIDYSERSVDPTADAGKVPQLDANGFFNGGFIKSTFTAPSYEPLDASSLPIPVKIHTDGSIIASEADVTTRQGFQGFITQDLTSLLLPTFLNATEGGGASFSHTANAGVDRVVVVHIINNASSPANPSAISWNGIAMTQVDAAVTTNVAASTWIVAIGDSGTNQAATLAITGGAGADRRTTAMTYSNVDQTTPFSDGDTKVQNSGTSISTASISVTRPYNLVVAGASSGGPGGGGGAISLSGLTTRSSVSNYNIAGDVFRTGPVTVSATGEFYAGAVTAVVINAANNLEVDIVLDGIIDGFTGLTPGSKYYVSNTVGVISTSPGASTIYVGTALSATQLYVRSSNA